MQGADRKTHAVYALHVIAGLEAAHGGPSYSVPRLCEAISAVGVRTSLLSVTRNGATTQFEGKSYEDRRFPHDLQFPLLSGLRLSTGLFRALSSEAAIADIVHSHGLWLMPNLHAGTISRKVGKPLVVAPRGMLAPAALAFSRRKKEVFWYFFQAPALRGAACFHATSWQEYEDIRAMGVRIPVAIVPNGIDLPTPNNQIAPKCKTVLFLGRIHPMKGLDQLLYAWARVYAQNPDWYLQLVGSAERGYDVHLKRLIRQLGLSRVSIKAGVFDEEKSRIFREAAIFVSPSLNENFGLTVAEALASGTPVISTKGTPWAGLESERCGWWIDHGVEPLAATLQTAMSLPLTELREMGERGVGWMARDFGWEGIAQKVSALYQWVLGGPHRPAFVQLD